MLEAPVVVQHVRARVLDDLRGILARFDAARPPVRRPARAASHHRRHGGSLAVARPAVARLGTDRRIAPLVVLALILVASLVAAMPAAGSAIGGTNGPGDPSNPSIADQVVAPAGALAVSPDASSGVPRRSAVAGPNEDEAQVPSDYAPDGTLLAPLSVAATATAFTAQTYVVQAGDTLTGVASHFGLSMMTIWWANHLTAKDRLHVGEKLIIPPVDGVLYTAHEGDTVLAVAAKYDVDPQSIVTYNSLTSDELTIGQQIMIPDGVGAAIAIAAPKASVSTSGTSHTSPSRGVGCLSCPFVPLDWPVPGGYISQGYHYGHWAIDIANTWGSPIIAAAAGTVTFAGWKSNGGGYQVWISHGHNFYTTYNHMSSTAVYIGEHVGRGQFIGRVGQTGDATGPHCHFEVWIGPIWDGGTRVNPLNYF